MTTVPAGCARVGSSAASDVCKRPGAWLALRTVQSTRTALPRVAFAIVALVLASGGVLAAADRTMHAYHNIWVPFTPEALAEALDRGDAGS